MSDDNRSVITMLLQLPAEQRDFGIDLVNLASNNGAKAILNLLSTMGFYTAAAYGRRVVGNADEGRKTMVAMLDEIISRANGDLSQENTGQIFKQIELETMAELAKMGVEPEVQS